MTRNYVMKAGDSNQVGSRMGHVTYKRERRRGRNRQMSYARSGRIHASKNKMEVVKQLSEHNRVLQKRSSQYMKFKMRVCLYLKLPQWKRCNVTQLAKCDSPLKEEMKIYAGKTCRAQITKQSSCSSCAIDTSRNHASQRKTFASCTRGTSRANIDGQKKLTYDLIGNFKTTEAWR